MLLCQSDLRRFHKLKQNRSTDLIVITYRGAFPGLPVFTAAPVACSLSLISRLLRHSAGFSPASELSCFLLLSSSKISHNYYIIPRFKVNDVSCHLLEAVRLRYRSSAGPRKNIHAILYFHPFQFFKHWLLQHPEKERSCHYVNQVEGNRQPINSCRRLPGRLRRRHKNCP